ncbi:MAG: hypothetical protein C0432_02915 [Candidatus Puniceispirillum sp.]|nr:hypothetical protein [Candidatus Pelagibacter sp.]MBA4283227.1 hypothetical protein [Candidatus Puniceispirillum sp.]
MLSRLKLFVALSITGILGVYFCADSSLKIRYYIYNQMDSYQRNKSKIAPYFDEKYYIKNCSFFHKNPSIPAIDHFMLRGWKGSWNETCDPNDWFNVTLFKEKIHKTSHNPFLYFIRSQPQKIEYQHKTVIYSTKDQTVRTWLLINALLQEGIFKPELRLSTQDYKNVDAIPSPFKILQSKGLVVHLDSKASQSLYSSPYWKERFQYDLKHKKKEEQKDNPPVINISEGKVFYKMHYLYRPRKWLDKALLQPQYLNFAKYTDESLQFSVMGQTEEEYSQKMRRYCAAFDLVFTGVPIHLPQERIIPGFLDLFTTQEDFSEQKEFTVSFLLSLGAKGLNSYPKQAGRIYSVRKELWDRQNEIKMKKVFYLSRRDVDKFPKELHDRVMPTDTKKPLFKSHYNVAIENTQQINYFTEKLLDCIAMEVVPIYIGCPNVGDYFDARGMIIVKDLSEMIEKMNTLKEDDYQKFKPYVLENKKRLTALLNLKNQYIKDFFQLFTLN